jgi:hypothetical protein
MGPLVAAQAVQGCWWLAPDQGWPMHEVAAAFKVRPPGAAGCGCGLGGGWWEKQREFLVLESLIVVPFLSCAVAAACQCGLLACC